MKFCFRIFCSSFKSPSKDWESLIGYSTFVKRRAIRVDRRKGCKGKMQFLCVLLSVASCVRGYERGSSHALLPSSSSSSLRRFASSGSARKELLRVNRSTLNCKKFFEILMSANRSNLFREKKKVTKFRQICNIVIFISIVQILRNTQIKNYIIVHIWFL